MIRKAVLLDEGDRMRRAAFLQDFPAPAHRSICDLGRFRVGVAFVAGGIGHHNQVGRPVKVAAPPAPRAVSWPLVPARATRCPPADEPNTPKRCGLRLYPRISGGSRTMAALALARSGPRDGLPGEAVVDRGDGAKPLANSARAGLKFSLLPLWPSRRRVSSDDEEHVGFWPRPGDRDRGVGDFATGRARIRGSLCAVTPWRQWHLLRRRVRRGGRLALFVVRLRGEATAEKQTPGLRGGFSCRWLRVEPRDLAKVSSGLPLGFPFLFSRGKPQPRGRHCCRWRIS